MVLEPKLKKFDRVIIKSNGKSGYIDAIVRDRCLIRLDDGYCWVDEWDLVLESKANEIQKPTLKSNSSISDTVRRMLGQ